MAAALWPNEVPLAVIRPDAAVYWHIQGLVLCGVLALPAFFTLLFGPGSDGGARSGWTLLVGAATLLAPTVFNAWGELRQSWLLTDQRLILPGGHHILLAHLDMVRARRRGVYVTARSGAKTSAHLGFLANPAAAAARIERARDSGR